MRECRCIWNTEDILFSILAPHFEAVSEHSHSEPTHMWWFLQLRIPLPFPLLILLLFNPVSSLLFFTLLRSSLLNVCVCVSGIWHECMWVGWWVGASVCQYIIDSLNPRAAGVWDAGVHEFVWVFKKGRLIWDQDNEIETFLSVWVFFVGDKGDDGDDQEWKKWPKLASQLGK